MSLTVRNDLDAAEWLTETIGEWWPTTTEQRNSSVFLTPTLAQMILEGAIGLEREQVEAKLSAMRRVSDRYPGHTTIRNALADLRRSCQTGDATVNRDFQSWCEDAIRSTRPMVVYAPSLLDNGTPRVTPHTNYWLERAARMLLHRQGRLSGSHDDVHLWHGQAVSPPPPAIGDPDFIRSTTHTRQPERFLMAASNIVGWLGHDKVHWASWIDRAQPRLFEPFQLRESQVATEFPSDPDAVRFYQESDCRATTHRSTIDYDGILRQALKRRHDRSVDRRATQPTAVST